LVPNANVSFTVSVLTDNGFTGAVALTAPALPAGITASFDPATVTPNGTSLLNIRATSTFVPQDFPLVVRGTSGSIVREAGTDLTLEFGLIPQCFGAVSGRVTDQVTGNPVAGVSVFGVQTDADGNYAATGLGLDPGNAPRTLFVTTAGPDFYPISPPATVRIACGVASTLDFSVLRRQFGAISGTITGIDVDGTPLGPIEGARYALNSFTGPSGTYTLNGLALGAANAPINTSVTVSASGFHSKTATTEVSAGTTSTLDLALRKVCTASVRVRVLDQRNGKAIEGARVDSGQATDSATTDANGIVIIQGVGLAGPDNRPAQRLVRAFTPDGITPIGTAQKTVTLGSCGAVVPVDLAVPFPRRVEATVDVLVVDDTGAPVEDATVRIGQTTYSSDRTGTDGRTTITHLLGIDVAPTLDTAITAFASGLLTGPALPLTLHEGETTEVTVVLFTRKFGAVEGTVRDRATGAPLGGISVNGGVTGPDGRYLIEGITLNGLNQPAQYNARAFDTSTPKLYWDSELVQVTVRADEVTHVPDLLMTRICQPATIRGRVINAVTREPIEGALVRVSSLSDMTDADGRFVITDISVGTDNQNLAYTVIASKEGFLTAQKTATVGCGADVVVDFGRDGDGVGTITGRVTDTGGNPVSQADVTTGFGGSARTNTNGEYTITNAPAGEDGADRDWTVTVRPPTNSPLEPATATATVRRDETTMLDFVLGSLADDPPVGASFAITIEPEPVPVTLAGADPTGDPLTFSIVTPPAHGTLTGTSPEFVYTPDAAFAGTDTIIYTANDGTNTSAPATITITVLPPNVPPVASIGGELEVDEDDQANLSGATSSDADGTIVLYEWDLDGDGQFDDDLGSTSSVREPDDAVVTVALRVTDDRGGTDTATAEVTFRNVAPEIDVYDIEVDGRT
ncbi:MAG TPA: carboxypeptidase regulatory-like domain-containing protein, partial [Ilumatobacteraceae bacterium]